jgi:hypothetical protein
LTWWSLNNQCADDECFLSSRIKRAKATILTLTDCSWEVELDKYVIVNTWPVDEWDSSIIRQANEEDKIGIIISVAPEVFI